ncbi:MAG: hypothetical protein M1820_003049 [Bogoriella megaspora]|nr:MAG: hypothetical protein M1820_003049 [Bogoriella megaspora]
MQSLQSFCAPLRRLSWTRIQSGLQIAKTSTYHEYSTSTQSEAGRDLFHYTSGRWLYNESQRLAERSLGFNVNELKRVVAKAVNRQEGAVQKICKLAEGGFNRTFEVTMNDGVQVIARLPYPTTVPKRYAIASEVATIDLVRSYGVPVPRIFDYATTPQNAVGSEYIIMEKMLGNEVGHRWFELSTSERKVITLDVAKIEGLLFSIPLPACGSVYYKRDLASTDESIDISDHKGLCVGPDAATSWWYDRRDILSVNRGPFKLAGQTMAAGALKELNWMKQFGRDRFPIDRCYRDILNYQKSPASEHIDHLEMYLQMCHHLVPENESLLRPAIRHPDLQPHNIFVSDDFKVVGLIDWQHCSILPLFLQAGVPKNWQNTTDEPTVIEKPTLPTNYEQLSEPEKAQAMKDLRQRQVHLLYLGRTARFNKAHMDAYLTSGLLFKRRLFDHAGAPWEGNNVSLKADLVLASKNWAGLAGHEDDGNLPPCPITFLPDEAEDCLQLHSRLSERDAEMENIRESIGIGSDGWVPNEGYGHAVDRNKYIKQQVIDSAENATAKALSLAHYPFDDHDEDD